MTQQLVLRPLGLITQPNKLGTIPQGALALADQCYMRQPGTIENANTYAQKGDSIIANATGTSIVVPTDGPYVYFNELSGSNRLYGWVDVTNNASYPFGFGLFEDEASNLQTLRTDGRFSTTINHQRLLVAATLGTFVNDLPTHSNTRSSGLLQPGISNISVPTATGSALPVNTHAMYTATYVRRFADGYEIVSPPSLAIEAINANTNATNTSIQFNFTVQSTNGYVVAGDYVQVWRTKSQAWNTSTNTYTNTGSDYYLALEYRLTATDISNGGMTLTDSVPDASLGEALYTNAGVKTQDGVALPSPTCKAMCTFKGYTFFFNRTDPPKFSVKSPTWWGLMGNSSTGLNASIRANGIGMRAVVGNITNGNPTISSVSAGDLVGVVIGQVSNDAVFGGLNTTVTAVGASSITFNRNFNTTATGTSINIGDVLEIDGNTIIVSVPSGLTDLNNQFGDLQHVCAMNLNNIVAQSVSTATIFPRAVPAIGVDIFLQRLNSGLSSTSLTVRATNGLNYVPGFPRIEAAETARAYTTTEVPNGLSWSEQNQPENVPPLNTAFCGNGEIYAAYPTRDCIWIFCSDGLYRLSGTGGSAGAEGFDWRIDPVDSTLIIAGPQAGCVLRDMVFAYTNRGLVMIESNGIIKELTLGRVDDRIPGQPWNAPSWSTSNALFLVADETNDEIWMKETLTPGNRVWIYNYITDCFTNDFIGVDTNSTGDAVLHGCYSRYAQSTLWLSQTQGCLVAPSVATARKRFDFKFQTLLGDDPFVTRMWQQVEFSAYLPTAWTQGIGQSITLIVNGDITPPLTVWPGTNCGQRLLQTPFNFQKTDARFWRTSWSIPRNAPAIANTIGLEFQSSGTAPTLVQGIAVKFVDITEQRMQR